MSVQSYRYLSPPKPKVTGSNPVGRAISFQTPLTPFRFSSERKRIPRSDRIDQAGRWRFGWAPHAIFGRRG